jgi:hypothetical protein
MPRIREAFTKDIGLSDESFWPREANFENIEELLKRKKERNVCYARMVMHSHCHSLNLVLTQPIVLTLALSTSKLGACVCVNLCPTSNILNPRKWG